MALKKNVGGCLFQINSVIDLVVEGDPALVLCWLGSANFTFMLPHFVSRRGKVKSFSVLTGVVFPWRKCVTDVWCSSVDVPQHEGGEAPGLYWPENWSFPQHRSTSSLHTPKKTSPTKHTHIDCYVHRLLYIFTQHCTKNTCAPAYSGHSVHHIAVGLCYKPMQIMFSAETNGCRVVALMIDDHHDLERRLSDCHWEM